MPPTRPRTVRETLEAEASGDLKIVRMSPSDSGAPGSIVSITFNRPVIAAPGHDVDAAHVLSLEPARPGVFEWRDPTTLRFVPTEPVAPGTKMTLSLDTAALATGGERSGVRLSMPLDFRGARPLAMLVEQHPANGDWATGPLPGFRVLYSTLVDLDSVANHSRLVFPAYCGGTVKMRAKRQRLVIAGEGAALENAGGFGRDTVYDRFRRVVELEPTDSLPPNCLGIWQVASFDTMRPLDGWQYGIRTAPPFSVKAVEPCLLASSIAPHNCEPDGLSIIFSAHVQPTEFAKHVRFKPAVQQAARWNAPTTIFEIPAPLKPHQRYAVTIDSTLRDVYGRQLAGPYTFTVTTRERATDLFHELMPAAMTKPK